MGALAEMPDHILLGCNQLRNSLSIIISNGYRRSVYLVHVWLYMVTRQFGALLVTKMETPPSHVPGKIMS